MRKMAPMPVIAGIARIAMAMQPAMPNDQRLADRMCSSPNELCASIQAQKKNAFAIPNTAHIANKSTDGRLASNIHSIKTATGSVACKMKNTVWESFDLTNASRLLTKRDSAKYITAIKMNMVPCVIPCIMGVLVAVVARRGL